MEHKKLLKKDMQLLTENFLIRNNVLLMTILDFQKEIIQHLTKKSNEEISNITYKIIKKHTDYIDKLVDTQIPNYPINSPDSELKK